MDNPLIPLVVAGAVIAVALAADQVDYRGTFTLGSIVVTVVVALGVGYLRVRANASQIWQGEHEAQKERGDRLQHEKDDVLAENANLRVKLAEAESRPDLQTVTNLVETQAEAGHELTLKLMELLEKHDKESAIGQRELAGEIRNLVRVLGERAQQFRAGDDGPNRAR